MGRLTERVGELTENMLFGTPGRALFTLGAAAYVTLNAAAFAFGTGFKTAWDAAEHGLGATEKEVVARFDESYLFRGPHGSMIDFGYFTLQDGSQIVVDDLPRPLDGKFLANYSFGDLEPGREYTLNLVGLGDANGDTVIDVN